MTVSMFQMALVCVFTKLWKIKKNFEALKVAQLLNLHSSPTLNACQITSNYQISKNIAIAAKRLFYQRILMYGTIIFRRTRAQAWCKNCIIKYGSPLIQIHWQVLIIKAILKLVLACCDHSSKLDDILLLATRYLLVMNGHCTIFLDSAYLKI